MIEEITEIFKQNPETFIVAGFILVVIFGFSTVSSYIIKKRIGYASFMGKIEHKSGRILGFLLALTIACEYFKLSFTLILLIVCFVMWCVYLLSHTFEKLLYGHYGSRG